MDGTISPAATVEHSAAPEFPPPPDLFSSSSSSSSLPPSSASLSFRFGLSGEDWFCLISVLTFCFFASVTLILGFFGSNVLLLGPNSSYLLQSNSLFVQDVQVKVVSGPQHGVMLYGFSDPPPLEITAAWLEIHNESIPIRFYKVWLYYLNEGSQVNISYVIESQRPYPLTLVIAQGKHYSLPEGRENLIQWTEDPSRPNTTLLWKSITGTGGVNENITKSSDYFIAVGNSNLLEVEVKLQFSIQALLYNTTGAYHNCSLHLGPCVWKLLFLQENSAILTTSQGDTEGEWYVEVSYGPRWVTYFVGSGVMALVIFVAFKMFSTLEPSSTNGVTNQLAGTASERSLLLPSKEDDYQSLGSSYDSNEEDVADQPLTLKLPVDGETEKIHRLCMFCCDAQRDCFFLPCGHCATCFLCGKRKLNDADICPMCLRKTKKVRRIFLA